MSSRRLPSGGRIDRSRTLRFAFDGRVYQGLPGDTLASALLAHDVALVGRSFKYHRPRGILSAGPEEPNALVELPDLCPTILDCCGLPLPDNLDGRSLTPLLEGLRCGATLTHRDRVFAEYSDNAEAMIRTDRWKLIYSAGNRVRQDGYAVDSLLGNELVQLFDLRTDPGELENRALDPACRGILAELLDELTDHLLRTERFPDQISRVGSQRDVLAAALLPTEERDPLRQNIDTW